MTTPYVTPDMLINAPTGIAWDIIPYPQAIQQLQTEEQYNICVRATALVDGYCNQVLRATVDTEQVTGPDFYLTVEQSTGVVRVILKRWPVLSVLAVSVSPAAAFPRTWTTLPAGTADVESPIIGLYGTTAPSNAADGSQAIEIAPGFIDWSLGRNGFRTAISYLNGWPHSSLTATATFPTSTLQVDDVTAFTGVTATIFDGSKTESVQVNSVTANTNLVLPISGVSVPAGPGTLNLVSPIANTHSAGIVVSALPASVMWATILAATCQALESGIDAITIQNIPGSQTVGGHGVEQLEIQWQKILFPYKRSV